MNAETTVVKSYATALFGAAKKVGITIALSEQTVALLKVFEANQSVRPLFESPRIPVEGKLGVIDKALKGRVHDLLVNFIKLLIKRGRLEQVRPCLEEFVRMVQAEQGIRAADVMTAKELSFAEKLQLKAALEKYSRFQLKIEYQVVPSLIGGVVFRCGDLLVDDSLRGHLDRLSKRLHGARVV